MTQFGPSVPLAGKRVSTDRGSGRHSRASSGEMNLTSHRRSPSTEMHDLSVSRSGLLSSRSYPAQVVDRGDGTYEVTFCPKRVGEFSVKVVLSGSVIRTMSYNGRYAQNPHACEHLRCARAPGCGCVVTLPVELTVPLHCIHV